MSTALTYVVSSVAWSVIGFVVGWFVASTRRSDLHRESAVPNSTFISLHGHRMTTQVGTRVIGIVVLLLAIFTVIQNASTSHHLSEVTDCQADFNHRFAEVSTLRAQLADQDRKALQDMLLALYQQRGADPKARLRTFRAWVDMVQSNERERKQHPLPELPKGECR